LEARPLRKAESLGQGPPERNPGIKEEGQDQVVRPSRGTLAGKKKPRACRTR
jgi:hypothetical protein